MKVFVKAILFTVALLAPAAQAAEPVYARQVFREMRRVLCLGIRHLGVADSPSRESPPSRFSRPITREKFMILFRSQRVATQDFFIYVVQGWRRSTGHSAPQAGRVRRSLVLLVRRRERTMKMARRLCVSCFFLGASVALAHSS